MAGEGISDDRSMERMAEMLWNAAGQDDVGCLRDDSQRNLELSINCSRLYCLREGRKDIAS
ncbi:hypothetical protein Dda_3550 [Drechslerella dactyloides]|uniref:Uncharacterized protein n=1 Tax=Drechslerella dactyloides TaxID=74499 RepID=A0AAD6NJN9_DREDA|nr:hypothetical protein Dda_3550 [Drechslerella dactyloides]